MNRSNQFGPARLAAAALLLAVLLAGCNSTPERIEAADGLAQGTRIGVLPINFLEKPSARVYNNALKFAGTAGRIAVTKADDSTRRKLTEGLDEQQFIYQDKYRQTLIDALTAAGYDAEYLDFRRSIDNVLGAVPPRRFEKRYPKPAGYDVLLDIYVDYVGYAAPGLTSPYLPTAHVAVRVVDAQSHAISYQSQIQYHPISDEEGVVGIEADESYGYDSVADLLEDIPRVKDGMTIAADAIVAKIVEELGN